MKVSHCLTQSNEHQRLTFRLTPLLYRGETMRQFRDSGPGKDLGSRVFS